MDRAVRFGIAAFVVIGLLVAAGLSSLPTLVSTDVARRAIEARMGEIIKLPVRLEGDTTIDFFPRPSATFNGLTITGSDNTPFMTFDQVEGDFEITSLFRATPTFSAFRIKTPMITVALDADRRLLWPALNQQGLERSATEAEDAAAPDNLAIAYRILNTLPAAIGSMTFEDGTVAVVHANGETRTVATRLAGSLDWPRRDGALSLDVTLSWGGRDSAIALQTSSMSQLFTQDGAPMQLDVSSGPTRFAFSGEAALQQPHFARGDLEADIGSTAELKRLAGGAPLLLAGIRELGIQGPVSVTGQRMRMDRAALTLNEQTGEGALEIVQREVGSPNLVATFDFDTLDVQALVQPAITALRSPFSPPYGWRKQFSGINADVRLSARQATLGALALTEFAGAASVREKTVTLDIGQAKLAGGDIQFRMTQNLQGAEPAGDIADAMMVTFNAKAVDTSEIASQLAIGPLFPRGPVDMSLSVNGDVGNLRTILESGEGTATVKSTGGNLPGIDIAELLRPENPAPFFALSGADAAASAGQTYQQFVLSMTLAGGVFRIDENAVGYPQGVLRSNGVISPINGSIALTTRLENLSGNLLVPPPVFIGGTLGRPFATFMLSPPNTIR